MVMVERSGGSSSRASLYSWCPTVATTTTRYQNHSTRKNFWCTMLLGSTHTA